MNQSVTPEKFCHEMMREYERQWVQARGHAERHPIRVKMQRLTELGREAGDAAHFDLLLTSGQRGADAEMCLLCEDLAPRWAAARAGEPFFESR